MVNTFISGILEFLRNIVNVFLEPLINTIDDLPGGSGIQDFYTGVSTIIYRITEGGVFVKRFLMVPDGLIGSFFALFTSLTICWGIVVAIQFIVRVYNIVKGPI